MVAYEVYDLLNAFLDHARSRGVDIDRRGSASRSASNLNLKRRGANNGKIVFSVRLLATQKFREFNSDADGLVVGIRADMRNAERVKGRFDFLRPVKNDGRRTFKYYRLESEERVHAFCEAILKDD